MVFEFARCDGGIVVYGVDLIGTQYRNVAVLVGIIIGTGKLVAIRGN